MKSWTPLAPVLLAVSVSAQTVFLEDFEAGADGTLARWSFQQARGQCAGIWDESEPTPAGRSVRLDITADATARATWYCTEKIAVEPDTGYELTFRLMIADVAAGSKGAYLIVYENGYEAPSHWHMDRFQRGSQDWHPRRLTFITRPDTTWLKLQCKLWETTGHAWFDDIAIRRIERDQVDAESSQTAWLPVEDGWPLQLAWYPAHRRADRTLCLLSDALNPVALFFRGDKARVNAPHLLIETPGQMTVTGPMVLGRRPPPAMLELKPERVVRDDEPRFVWRIPIDESFLKAHLKPDGIGWEKYCFIYVTPEPECAREFTWRWRLENSGAAGPAHELPGRLVPRLGPGALEPLPRFKLYAQHSSALRYPTRQGRARILDTLFYAGIRGGLALSFYQAELKAVDTELNEAGFCTWSWAWHGYGGPCKDDQKLVFASAKSRPRGAVCPQVQAERLEPFWSWLVERYRKPLALDMPWLIMNYEPPVFDVCFCARCRTEFAQFAALHAARVDEMAPKEIQSLPDNQWGRFRAQQNARVIRTHVAAIRKTDAHIRIGICGPPQDDWTANRGMDIRLFEPEVTLHAPMIYRKPSDYERFVRSTCEQTNVDVMPFLLASDVAVKYEFPTAKDVRLNMLATALSGGQGAILWVGMESLDGEYLAALRRSMEEIRQLEPYIAGGTRRADVGVALTASGEREVRVGDRVLTVTAQNTVSPVRSWAWESGRGTMVGLINYDTELARTVTLTGDGIGVVTSLLGPAPERLAGGVSVRLAPGEFGMLVW